MGKFLIALKQLQDWFDRQKRILPWRDLPTPYRVWISEIMLQQTQVITVIPFFQRFIDKYPDVEKLARAPIDDVLLLWSGLGYYSRARNLHQGAKKIVEMGRFPKTRDEWLEVPGVGPYTAGAILSIAENVPEAILDGNIERVLSRVRRVSRDKGDAAFKSRLWRIAGIFVSKGNHHQIPPSVLNQALMELGATICSPRSPRCPLCPLRSICRARQFEEQELYPPKKKPKKWVLLEEKLNCVVNHKGQVLLRKRNSGEWRSGLWDLLETEPKKLKLSAEPMEKVETRHVVTQHKIRRVTQIWKLSRPASRLLTAADSGIEKSAELRWVSIDAPEVAVGSAVTKTLLKVREALKART